MTLRKYKSPAAFKQALEQRLRTVSMSGVDFARRRQLLVFDRFLARVVQVMGETVILGEPDVLVAEDVLAFAGIAPPKLRLYPVESQIAEKLHAYTMPRERENSRVKDLPDLALPAKIRELDAERLHRALEQTFTFRKTHALPSSVPEPPASWAEVYRRMAEEDELEWRTLPDLVAAVRIFLDPILGGASVARWSPSGWNWTSE